ncbi:MAG: hypothetical protein KDC28_09205 [Saprospiraceae bacterium]|nr:hypothetical protein [Saprospiraceae bacterium]MCB9320325.1 hypothetical protein [Lewinellaceae bacterium]
MKCAFILLLLLTSVGRRYPINLDTLKYEIVGKLVVVHAKVDGNYGNFILDTGIRDLVLNSKYYQGKKSNSYIQGINGVKAESEFCYVDFSFNSIELSSFYALITDLHLIEKKIKRPILGLIGTKIFKDGTLILDYSRNHMIFINGKSYSQKSNGYSVKFQFNGLNPYIVTTLNGKSYRWNLDSGASINVLDEHCNQDLRDFLVQSGKIRLIAFGSGGIIKEHAFIRNLPIALWILDPMETVISQLNDYNLRHPGKNSDGILGYEFLRQMTVAIDFRHKDVYLFPKENQLIAFYLNRLFTSTLL